MLQGLPKERLARVIVTEAMSEGETGTSLFIGHRSTGARRGAPDRVPPTPATNKLTKLAPSMLGWATMQSVHRPNIDGALLVNLFFAGVGRMLAVRSMS